ncbi:unnamed protein product [Hapterophycus canaliculatus]
MRYDKGAIAAASAQALVLYGHGTHSFGVADGTAKFSQRINRFTIQNMRTCASRPTKATVSRNNDPAREVATSAADDTGSEQIFAAGGAEQIAELLAGENSSAGGVFYNRVGAINRDLSILMANVLAEERRKETLVGGKRKKRRTQTLESGSTSMDEIKQTDVARSGGRWGVGTLFKGVLRRLSQGRLRGYARGRADRGDATVFGGGDRSEEQREGREEDGEGLVVLDAFAASGVRALRYLTEVPNVQRVVANDYDPAAIEMIRRAADLCGAGNTLEVHRGDALDTLYSARAKGLGTFDIIDIDPFGCAAGFLDAGVQAISDGGLLCVTSTDMPVLSGAQPEVAWARYGSVPTKSGYHHEMSLRILLQAISAAAGRHRRSIHPVLSVAIDHYVRVFVRVSRSPKAALAAAQESTSYVLQSEACPSFFLLPILPPKKRSPKRRVKSKARGRPENVDSSTAALPVASPQNPSEEEGEGATGAATPAAASHSPPLGLGGVCPETGGALRIGGPIWSGPLHDEEWVARAIAIASASGGPPPSEADGGSHGVKEADALAPRPRLAAGARVESLLRSVAGELPDVPLFYNLRDMFATLGFKNHPRKEQVMGALEAAGYRVSGMHKEPLAVKTDAPDAAVWDVLRCWARDSPQPAPVRAAGVAILGRGTQMIAHADFEAVQLGLEGRAGGAVTRAGGGFLHAHNPEQDWGPLARRSVFARVDDEPNDVELPAGQAR